MKNGILSVLFLLLATLGWAQKKSALTFKLEPSRGYCKQLAEIDSNPASNEAIDQQTFLTESSTIERRLSLKPVFLTDVKVDDFEIENPPANSSAQTRAEINYLLSLQTQRTKDEVDRSLHMAGVYYNPRTTPADENYESYRKNLFFIGRSIGSWFNPQDLPKTANLMARVWQDASYFIWALKFKYARIRPYIIDESLENLEETNWAAYPSGHASNSYINAFIYRELAPEYSDVFLKDAYDMAHSREIIGVHYPSDSESGRQFAHQFVSKLFQNEQFLKELEEVKQEWKLKAKESFLKPIITDKEKKQKDAASCATPTTSCAKACN
ncbi:MAG: phosphatase [Flammeovirgaceae bacterium]|nr:phosphatase [Flammeovirgaceae bacterium]